MAWQVAGAQPLPSNPAPVAEPAPEAAKAAKKHEVPVPPALQPLSTPWRSPELTLAAEIDLRAGQANPAEKARTVEGGEFVENGWQAKGKLDRLSLELTEGFPAHEPGAIELDMTNLDFVNQIDGKKQHFFGLYSNPSGSHFILPANFFTLRGGLYNDKEGNRGIKVLWRGNAVRGEHAPFAARKVWNLKETYTWRAEWTKEELVMFLNGERIFGPAEFKDRNEAMPLKYVFLSRDGCPDTKIWFGFPGPIYQKLRVYRPAAQK